MVAERTGRKLCATNGGKYGVVFFAAVLFTEINRLKASAALEWHDAFSPRTFELN